MPRLRVAAYIRDNQSRTNERVTHFGEALGAEFSTRDRPINCDLAVQAGFQITPAMRDAMDRGVPIIVLENPVWHYGDKPSTYTWAYNGLGAGGMVSDVPARSRPHPTPAPWKGPESGQITIFGQVEHDKSLRGVDIYEWAEWVQQIVPAAVFREHPIMLSRKDQQESFEDCLAKTSISITYNSTVGPQSIIQGISTVALGPHSLCGEMASQSLSEPLRQPDRSGWLHELSWRHWSTDEELDVEYILNGYESAKAQAEKGEYDNMSNGRPQ